MIPWNLGDKELREWALQKLAKEALLESKEEFVEKNPSEKLVHIYKVLDGEVMPTLSEAGIPIRREELHKMFLSWFVRQASPVMKRSQASPDNDDGITVMASSIVNRDR